jgi:hypothetical protein
MLETAGAGVIVMASFAATWWAKMIAEGYPGAACGAEQCQRYFRPGVSAWNYRRGCSNDAGLHLGAGVLVHCACRRAGQSELGGP